MQISRRRDLPKGAIMKSEILRLIAGGLLALICCYIGLLIKRRYASRVTFFKSASAFCIMLSDELSMRKTPIPAVVSKFTAGRKGVFEDLLCEWAQNAKLGKNSDFDKYKLLKNDETKDVATFLDTLGKTDLRDQIAHVKHYKEAFDRKTTECETQSKKQGSMYFKLCVLLGIAIILILA